MTVNLSTELVGKMLGQYRLDTVIGEGGLATVFKAYQASLERWVAVKVLDSDDRELLARFEQEAKTIAELQHRNILTVYDYGAESGWFYIAMEYVRQGTLENYLDGKPLDWGPAIELIIAIAEALDYAHRHGLIHRDIKPSNVLLPQPDWPLLADFGLVKVQNSDKEITGSDLVMGTAAYMSPEQAWGEPAEARSDIYSLGVVMFEMITGRLPFNHRSDAFLMNAHVSAEPPAPSKFNPDCPADLEAIILKTLAKSAGDRYPTMQMLIQALREVISNSFIPALTSATPESKTGPLKDTSPAVPVEQQARILVPDRGTTIDLPDPDEAGLIIGRSHSKGQADIDLGPYSGLEKGVSRRHARLIQRDREWWIEDLDSLNHTYVQDKELKPGLPERLNNGSIIRCAQITLVFLIVTKT